ncbi:MAG: hypothetical protein VZS44_09185 [Bacilli bacterium]|nr:hypothetical protein [Bacilli bacterium]
MKKNINKNRSVHRQLNIDTVQKELPQMEKINVDKTSSDKKLKNPPPLREKK